MVIASPNNTQAAVAAQSIEAGLPVLCEKPVGQSVDDAKTMVTLSQQQNVLVGVVLNQRAQRHSRWIKSQIETGTLKPRSISFTGRPARLTGWYADPDVAGGGVLRTIGMHYLDLCTWWSGSIEIVEAVLSGAPVEDKIEIKGKTANGYAIDVRIDTTETESTSPMQCVIEAEAIEIKLMGHEVVSVTGLPQPPPAEPADPDFPFGPGHLAVIAEAMDSLSRGEPFPVPLSELAPLLESIQDLKP